MLILRKSMPVNKETNYQKCATRSSHCGAAEPNPASIHEDSGLIPALTQWLRDPELLWAVRCMLQMWLVSHVAVAVEKKGGQQEGFGARS